MANYLASIFGTEQDKVRILHHLDTRARLFTDSSITGQLLLLLQNRRMPSRRPLLAQTCQALILANHPPPQLVPEPGIRPQEQDEPATTPKPLRRLLRGFLV